MTEARRQELINGDLAATRSLPAAPAAPVPRSGLRRRHRQPVDHGRNGSTPILVPAKLPIYAPGVQVVISTHQRPERLRECLASIEVGMRGTGVRWLLVIGVDGPDPESQAIAGNHQGGADRCIVFPFRKAPTVAVAKNRVLGMALAHRDEYPWLLLMDDDDLFYQARVTELLAGAIKFGHKFALGNWESWKANGGWVSPVNMLDRSPGDTCHFGPQLTVLHADLVPTGGHLFDPDVTVWEDVIAWHRLHSEGHEVAVIDTPNPVFRQRVFPGNSASRPYGDDTEANLKHQKLAEELRLARYPLRSDVQSVATVCVSPRGHDEVRLMLTSFRLFEPKGRRLPVHIVCDPESEALIHSWHLDPVVTHPLASDGWLEQTRGRFDSLHQNPAQELRLPSEVMAAKQTSMLKALEQHANVLYLDGDTVCVGDLDGDVFNPRGADACVTSHHRCHNGHGSWRYGFWQAGCAFVANPAFVRDWVDEFWHDTSYGDQHVLTGVAAQWVVDDLPRGYNIGPWSYYVDDPSSCSGPLNPVQTGDDQRPIHPLPEGHDWQTPCREFERRVELKVGRSGMYWRGRRLRTVHVHTWPARSLPNVWRYNENLRLALRRMLTVSGDPRHKSLVPLLGPL